MNWEDIVEYDETSPTGLLWKKSLGIICRDGSPAGTFVKRKNGKPKCVQFTYNKKHYKCHRVIWQLKNGDIPSGYVVDHKDKNPWNNKISNLRLVKQKVNTQNASLSSYNTSGVCGVGWNKKCGFTYARAYVTVNGKQVSKIFNVRDHGLLPAFKMAVCWRRDKIMELNSLGESYSETHGKDKHENQNY